MNPSKIGNVYTGKAKTDTYDFLEENKDCFTFSNFSCNTVRLIFMLEAKTTEFDFSCL